jgi:hypothetical protein
METLHLNSRAALVVDFFDTFVATWFQTQYGLDKGRGKCVSTKAAGLSCCTAPGNVQTARQAGSLPHVRQPK